MAAAKPIVASQIEGYASVLEDGVEGVLVPPMDELALANAIVGLCGDRALRQEIGTKGRQKVENFSWQNIAQRLEQYYTNLIEGTQ